MKKFINPLLRVGTAVALLSVIYMQNTKIAVYQSKKDTMDSLNKLVDSLQLEKFNAENAAGRYELSLQHLEEVNPKAAKQFNDYLQNETE